MMALRVVALSIFCASASLAPFQCARDPDPSRAREESPGEALYGLAMRFRENGDREAERATLRYIVERYPASRFAARAKDDLGTEGAAPAKSSTPAP